MKHQTIIRYADGTLISINCPCGEDHGPSLHEELMIVREGNRRQAERLADLVDVLKSVLDLTDPARTSIDRSRKARRLVANVSLELNRTARDLTVLS